MAAAPEGGTSGPGRPDGVRRSVWGRDGERGPGNRPGRRTSPRDTALRAARAPHAPGRAGGGGGSRPPGAAPAGGAPADPHRSPGRGQVPPGPGPGGARRTRLQRRGVARPPGAGHRAGARPARRREGPGRGGDGRGRAAAPPPTPRPAPGAPPAAGAGQRGAPAARGGGGSGRPPRGLPPPDGRRHQPGRPAGVWGAAIPGAPTRPARAAPRRGPGSGRGSGSGRRRAPVRRAGPGGAPRVRPHGRERRRRGGALPAPGWAAPGDRAGRRPGAPLLSPDRRRAIGATGALPAHRRPPGPARPATHPCGRRWPGATTSWRRRSRPSSAA